MKDSTGLKNWLDKHFGQFGIAFYAFCGCLLLAALIGLIALLIQWPLLFPSLGPTIILFFERGQRPAAWPRNVLIGHGVAIAAGWIGLYLFGLHTAPHILEMGMTPARIGAAALSLALTAFVKHLLHAPHPPAGATTLIISLGFYTGALQISALVAGIVLTTILGYSLNRLSGGTMPIWGRRSRSS